MASYAERSRNEDRAFGRYIDSSVWRCGLVYMGLTGKG